VEAGERAGADEIDSTLRQSGHTTWVRQDGASAIKPALASKPFSLRR
jgi:hypothetical protein